jgi:hypothetical protein
MASMWADGKMKEGLLSPATAQKNGNPVLQEADEGASTDSLSCRPEVSFLSDYANII